MRAAFSYFSMLPVGVTGAPDASALAWLPIVGIVLGALAGAAAWGVAAFAPPAFVVATAFGASIAVSGAIHLDGFLDACDALAASVPPERRLEIMKDPRHGTFALAGFAVVAAWWVAALASLPAAQLPLALAFAGGTARLAAVQNARVFPYGRAGASARAFDERPPLGVLALGAAALIAVALVAREPLWIAAGLAACGVALALGRFAAGRLDGVLVGDVYGAIVVVLDVALLSTIALLQGH